MLCEMQTGFKLRFPGSFPILSWDLDDVTEGIP